MSIHLVIEDPKSAVSVHREVAEGQSWALKDAIEELVKEVARATESEPYAVLFSLQPHFFVRLLADEE